MSTLNVHIARFPDDIEIVRALFREYSEAIADVAACSLQFQGFEKELAALPWPYDPPLGRVFLASVDGEAAGCVAIKPLKNLGEGVGEVKRMYVKPTYRGLGLGKALVDRLIKDARLMGYSLLKLDTSSSMHAAMAVYRGAGFVPCERYNDDPMTDTLWFECRL